MSSRWVEKIRYSEGFKSEEDAKKFLDEQLRWFIDIEKDMRTFHEKMLSLTDAFFRYEAKPVLEYKPEDLIGRIESLERELAEVKDLIKQKYGLQKYAKPI
jgi:hypothetical protein